MESRPSPYLAPILLGLCHLLRSPWHCWHQTGEGRVCSVIYCQKCPPYLLPSLLITSLFSQEGNPIPFVGREGGSTVELLGSQVMEYFPFHPSAFSFPERLGQGPSLAISRTCAPSLPNPVLSLNCRHPLVRPLLPRGDLLRGPGPLSEI